MYIENLAKISLKTPLIIVAGIALKDRVDLIFSLIIPLEVVAKYYKQLSSSNINFFIYDLDTQYSVIRGF